jgi:ABC-type uncharacterized transport system fused permease/ATPase subunit
MLQIRWRRWLTRRYLGAWLANRAYYQLQLKNGADNPDQRIAEDINQFTNYVLTLSLGVLTSLVTLGSFLCRFVRRRTGRAWRFPRAIPQHLCELPDDHGAANAP